MVLGRIVITCFWEAYIFFPWNNMPCSHLLDQYIGYMNEDFIKRLKEIYKTLIPVEDEVYEKLVPYLEGHAYPKGIILKDAGKTENRARLILDGVICQYGLDVNRIPIARKIYLSGHNAFDIDSYTDQKPTDSILVTKTEVKTIEITKENENLLLLEVPEASNLAVRINHELTKNLIKWENILQLPTAKAYEAIIHMYPNLGNILKVKDFQDILGISKSTLTRIRSLK